MKTYNIPEGYVSGECDTKNEAYISQDFQNNSIKYKCQHCSLGNVIKSENENENEGEKSKSSLSALRSAPPPTAAPLLTDLRASLLGVVARDAEEVVGRRARAQPPVATRPLIRRGRHWRRCGCVGNHGWRQSGRVGYTGTRAWRHEGRQSRGDEVVLRPAQGAVLVRGVAAVGSAVAGFLLQSKGGVSSWPGGES